MNRFSAMQAQDRRVLVTGGAGFIGSALVWELNRRGTGRIVVCDVGSDEVKMRHLPPLRFESYVDAAALFDRLHTNELGRFDLVLHMGACSSTTEQDMGYLLRNNYEFTQKLARWSLDTRARFVYASSAATYGDGSRGMSDGDDVASLKRLQPLNKYGYSKHLFDLYAAENGMLGEIAGLKYFNVFGPNEDHKGEMRSVVHKAYEQIRDTGRVRLFKSHRPDYAHGEQKRDFLYVKDAVAMTMHLADSGANGLYNIGSGAANTWNALVGAVFAALGKKPNVEFIDMPEEIRDKYQYFTQADISKLRRAGYTEPVTPLDESVRDYVVNYLVPGKNLGE